MSNFEMKKILIGLDNNIEKTFSTFNSVIYVIDVLEKKILLLDFENISKNELISFLKSVKKLQNNKDFLKFNLIARDMKLKLKLHEYFLALGLDLFFPFDLQEKGSELAIHFRCEQDVIYCDLSIIKGINTNSQINKSVKNIKKSDFDNRDIVLIGSSTGGTEVIKEILSDLPLNFPPILIVQHMPPDFTPLFAQRLTQQTGRKTFEVVDEMVLKENHAYLACGKFHMKLKSVNGQLVVYPDDSEPLNRFKPSVSALFGSVGDLNLGHRSVAIMLTGMGSDGVVEMKRLNEMGSICLAQNEDSCVVFGMPKAAIDIGAIDYILTPKEIIKKLSKLSLDKNIA